MSKKKNYKIPSFDYDEQSDVMYITFGEPKKCRGDDVDDVVLFHVPGSEELNGITIIDYNKRTNKE